MLAESGDCKCRDNVQEECGGGGYGSEEEARLLLSARDEMER